MDPSQARIAANRRNAQRSTGPKTAEGKARSRANALKHGLCSSVLVAEDAEVVRQRSAEFFDTLKPQNHYHCWLVTEAALASIKIQRCERMDRRARDKVAIRAELGWEGQRRVEAKLLGEQLASRPEIVVEELLKTPQGCEWMADRWSMLAFSAESQEGGWTPDQERLAFDLLGTPPEFRQGHKPNTTLDSRGRRVEGGDDPAEFARRQIVALEAMRDEVEGLDEANRALAIVDLADDVDPELKRIRRYESSLHGRLRWCLKEIRAESPSQPGIYHGLKVSWLGRPSDDVAPALPELPEAELPEPEPLPEPPALDDIPRPEPTITAGRFPDPTPPFDLEVDELPPLGEPLNIPKILSARRQKALKKAQSRREARRRKLEEFHS